MLAATNFLTQNVTPKTFLWILPLAAYIASFIVAFDGERWYSPSIAVKLGWLALLGLAAPLRWSQLMFDVPVMALLITAGVFVVSLVCHGETVRRRPAPEHLTRFYLAVSIGGAVGGVAVGVLAPLVLPATTEYLVSVLACAVVTAFARPGATRRYKMVAALATLCIAVVGFSAVKKNSQMAVHSVRNFYGSLRVLEDREGRQLVHGAIVHGSFTRPARHPQQIDEAGLRAHIVRVQSQGKVKTMTLSADEFIWRFLLRVRPNGFQRIRYYGFLASRNPQEKLCHCRHLLGMPPDPPDTPTMEPDYRGRYEELTGCSLRQCPQRQRGRMVLVASR